MTDLSQVKKGDRLRITVEGVVLENQITETEAAYASLTVNLENDTIIERTTFLHGELTHPTAKVEKLLPKIEVGDRVVIGAGAYFGKVLGVQGAWLWLDNDNGPPATYKINQVTKVTKWSA